MIHRFEIDVQCPKNVIFNLFYNMLAIRSTILHVKVANLSLVNPSIELGILGTRSHLH